MTGSFQRGIAVAVSRLVRIPISQIVPSRARSGCTIALLLVLTVLYPLPARGQSPAKSFTGLYFGIEAGALNVIGGAQVAAVDTLAQDTRAAVTFVAGGRYEFSRLVLGIEFGAGWEDGDLTLDDPVSALHVDYANDGHTRIGVTAGVTVGNRRRTQLFAYLSELSRSFDVTVTQAGVVTAQQDEQGLLRYGGGIEQVVGSRLSVRGTLGSSRADFGGRPTNIKPTQPFEAALAILFRF